MLHRLPQIENKRFWFSLIIGIKLLLAIFLYYEVLSLGYEKNDGLFIITGDTFSYYEPMKAFLTGDRNLDSCRMPGFVPLYALPYWMGGESLANNFIILCQFLFSILSVYTLGLIAFMITKIQWVPKMTILIFAVSTFVSQYDIFAIADSLSISTLIFSIYFFFKYEETSNRNLLIYSGFFFSWSIFFRQIAIVAYGLIGLMLIYHFFKRKEFKSKFLHIFGFGIPFVIMLGSWTLYNKSTHNRFIPMVKPIAECYSGYPDHQFTLLKLPIAWGGVFTKWNGEGEWFQNPKMKKSDFPFGNVFTHAYNLDSLENLRQLHFTYFDKTKSEEERNQIAKTITEKSLIYLASYKSEYTLNYWVINKFVLLKKFLFPTYLDKLPLPPFNEMNIVEKGVKVFYILLLWFVNFFGVLGMLNWRYKTFPLTLISGGIILFLTFYLGWAEQRYLSPVYPFMVIFTSISLYTLLDYFKRRKKIGKA